jgi:hypothetical protein
MSIIAALNNALSGIRLAEKKTEKTAANIARFGQPDAPDRLPEDIVDLKIARAAHAANVRSLKAAEEMNEEIVERR